MLDKKTLTAAGAALILAVITVTIAFSNPTVQGEVKELTGSAPDNPNTVYGYLPVSTSSGFLDFGPLMVAGEAPSQDATADKYRCHDNNYYIDQDGDRGVQYYSGDHISGGAGYYFYGYDKSYSFAEVCGGRYNYQCEMGSGCDGFVEDDSSDDDSGSDDTGDSGSDDSSSSTNEAPEIESIDTPASVNTSETFTVSVEASDPDTPSLSYSWSNGASGQSISLNYGKPGVQELDVEVSDGEKSVSSTVRVNVVEEDEGSEDPRVTDPKPANPVVQLWDWFVALFPS